MSKRILFAAHDPGGYNVVEPLIGKFITKSVYSVVLALTGPAALMSEKYRNGEAEFVNLPTVPFPDYPCEVDVEESHVEQLILDKKPDVIITSTSINSNLERYAIKFAQQYGIENYVYIDSWLGEDIRFTSNKVSVVPSNILVCDNDMGKPYLGLQSKGAKIHVVGNAHLEDLARRAQNFKKGLNERNYRMVFFSENIKHYYPHWPVNEFTVVKEILSNTETPCEYDFVIRPHPLESRKHWQYFIEENKHLNTKFRLKLDDSKDVYDSIFSSDINFGISTMALIESSIMGIPTISYQVKIKNESNMLYLPYKTYGINSIRSYEQYRSVISSWQKGNLRRFKLPILNSLEQIENLLAVRSS